MLVLTHFHVRKRGHMRPDQGLRSNLILFSLTFFLNILIKRNNRPFQCQLNSNMPLRVLYSPISKNEIGPTSEGLIKTKTETVLLALMVNTQFNLVRFNVT